MPHARNPNREFSALPVKGKNELAETPCAICEEIASVRVRTDGWIDIRCTNCGYVESALSEQSFNSLIGTILNEPKTAFMRSTKTAVSYTHLTLPTKA